MESAKVFRVKRAKPVYERIITVLRDLYKQFKDLIKKYNRLVTAYNDKCSNYEQLEGHCQWLEGENSQLSVKLHTVQRDYSRVRRVLGDVMVDNALFAAEQLEQEANSGKDCWRSNISLVSLEIGVPRLCSIFSSRIDSIITAEQYQ